MSENQSTTQNNTSGVTVREFDISLWQELLHFAEHVLYELEEEGCLEKEDREYYEALRQALLCVYREYFLKGDMEKEKVFKVTVIEVLETFVNRLFGCI